MKWMPATNPTSDVVCASNLLCWQITHRKGFNKAGVRFEPRSSRSDQAMLGMRSFPVILPLHVQHRKHTTEGLASTTGAQPRHSGKCQVQAPRVALWGSYEGWVVDQVGK
jgi:hypothetical protein